MYKILKAIVISDTIPQNNDVLWLRPLEKGTAIYIWKNGTWEVLKLMDDHGTSSVYDDTPYEPGGGGELGPNTVGSEEIIDKSVQIKDLNKEVTDKLDDTYVEDKESLYINGTKPE